MRLARRTRRLRRPIEVRLLTPEEHPLAALGRGVGDFLLAACAQADVEVRFGVHLDPDVLAGGQLVDKAGALDGADLTIAIPSHRGSPLLRDLTDGSVLVPVDDRFATAVPGTFVAGDAAANAYPRAADPAAVSGVVAAEAAMTELGYGGAGPLQTPEPDCFVDHGDGRYGRIRISYPDGLRRPDSPRLVSMLRHGSKAQRSKMLTDAGRRCEGMPQRRDRPRRSVPVPLAR